MKKIYFIILLLLGFLNVDAQVQVESKIDSIQILIGQQAHVTLDVNLKKGQKLEMPKLVSTQQLTPGVEIIDVSTLDTSKLDNEMMRVRQIITLTSFDEKLYYLPPLKVKVNGKQYESKSLALKVLTVPVDTLHPEKFFPPKNVQDNPFQWSEWSGIFLLSFIIILLLCVVFYLRVRLNDNKPVLKKIRLVKKLPPHQKAMNEIEKIKSERMTSSEDQKTYYTRLTDTIRKYIEERFGFNAMEMTSSEIIWRLQKSEEKDKLEELKELFNTADLVKFAKYTTHISENDANLVSAVNFINSTKLESQSTIERIEPKLTVADKRSARSRFAIKWSMIALGIIVLVLFIYVIYRLTLLF